MKDLKYVLILLIFFISVKISGQENSSTRNVICFTPTKAHKVNGLSLGIWNTPQEQLQVFNGINFEIVGQGWMTPFLGLDDGGYLRKTNKKHVINGASFGLTLFNGQVNGLAVSPLINTIYHSNGLKISPVNVGLYNTKGLQIGLLNLDETNIGLSIGVYNQADSLVGTQIGLINKTGTSRGCQIGLINMNKSRTTILFNWATRKE